MDQTHFIVPFDQRRRKKDLDHLQLLSAAKPQEPTSAATLARKKIKTTSRDEKKHKKQQPLKDNDSMRFIVVFKYEEALTVHRLPD